MAQNFTPEIMDKIKSVTAMNYRDQAIWYLNAFWTDAKPAETEAETVYQLITAFSKEDHVKGKNGCELNPIQAFNVLQKRNQTLTALELKAQLRKVDIDANGEMALCEYLLFINERDPVAFVTNPQGQIDLQKLKALEAKMEELDVLMAELQVKEAAAVAAEEASKQAEADAIAQEEAAKVAEQLALDEEAKAKAAEQVAREEEAKAKASQAIADDSAAKAKAAEDEVRAVEDEARAVAAEIKAQEDAKDALITRLEATSTDQTVGIVKRNMAVQELAQAKNEDPLPLRKAKLTQDAVVRKLAKVTESFKVITDEANAKAAVAKADADVASAAADKATEAANAAERSRIAAVASRVSAEEKRAQAVAARQAAEQAVVEVKAAIAEATKAFEETEAALNELKAQADGAGKGLEWMLSRDLEEKKRSLPTRMW